MKVAIYNISYFPVSRILLGQFQVYIISTHCYDIIVQFVVINFNYLLKVNFKLLIFGRFHLYI